MFEKAAPAKAGTAGFIWVRSLDVVIDHRGRLVQQLGTGQQPLEVLERGGVIEAVADALIRVDGVVDVLAADDGAVVENLIFMVLAAEGHEHWHVAEVVQVMHDRRDTEGAHGGKEDRRVERADLQNWISSPRL